jgi:hypothetical protein
MICGVVVAVSIPFNNLASLVLPYYLLHSLACWQLPIFVDRVAADQKHALAKARQSIHKPAHSIEFIKIMVVIVLTHTLELTYIICDWYYSYYSVMVLLL